MRRRRPIKTPSTRPSSIQKEKDSSFGIGAEFTPEVEGFVRCVDEVGGLRPDRLLEKRTPELKQKEAQIAVLESRLETLELRNNHS
jgi:hypothetical protein